MGILNTPTTLNPFATMGISRSGIEDLSVEGAQELAKAVFRYHAQSKHPDRHQHLPQHPNQGGSQKNWEKLEATLKSRWDAINQAYKEISDPAKCKRAIDSYKPMSQMDELTELREAVESSRQAAKELRQDSAKTILDLTNPQILSVRNCGPCTLHLLNLEAILDVAKDEEAELTKIFSGKPPSVLIEKELSISKAGDISGKPDSRLVCTLLVNNLTTSPRRFLETLNEQGLRLPDSSRVLGVDKEGADGSAGAPNVSRKYRLDYISEEQFAAFAPIISVRLDVDLKKGLVIVVSGTRSSSSDKVTIDFEGLLFGIDRG